MYVRSIPAVPAGTGTQPPCASADHRSRGTYPELRRANACCWSGGIAVSGEFLETLGQDDPAGCLDQGEVGESLREVAEVQAGFDVEFLCEQTQR